MDRILMTPGPTNIPQDVFESMAVNIHHRSDEFLGIMKSVRERLKKVFGTKNDVVILPSSGTGGLEASIVNIFSPGDRLLCVNCGVFGKRFAEIARVYGVNVQEKIIQWGYGITEDELEDELKKHEYKAVYVTYSETSTGVKNNIKAIGSIVKKYNSLFVVDAVSAIGSLEFNAEEFNVDAAIAGSQKGFMCPPGLSFVSLSDNALKAVEVSKTPKFYFDFRKYNSSEMMPFTPVIPVILGLDRSLSMILNEGLENIWDRHLRLSNAVKKASEQMGLKEFPLKEFDSEVLTALYVPEGLESKKIIEGMKKWGVVITGGQGALKDRIIRIGHMGYVTEEHIKKTIKSLSMTLNSLGFMNDTEDVLKVLKLMLEV